MCRAALHIHIGGTALCGLRLQSKALRDLLIIAPALLLLCPALSSTGDSRVVLCRRGTAVQLTQDHKPDREDERVRIMTVTLRLPHSRLTHSLMLCDLLVALD